MPKNTPLLIEIGQGLSIMVGLPTINTWGAGDRPQNARAGTFGYNTATNNLEYYDGKDWFGAELKKA